MRRTETVMTYDQWERRFKRQVKRYVKRKLNRAFMYRMDLEQCKDRVINALACDY